jgi:DNA-binding response OmpR family regulator
VCNDPFEDWVRAPISRDDLDARVRALQNRLDSRQIPTLDSAGTLTFGSHSITVSNVQTELMELLIEHFGEVVYRHELAQRLAERVQRPTRNSLDLHIMRLRRRLASTDLVIRTAWGRGYALEVEAR